MQLKVFTILTWDHFHSIKEAFGVPHGEKGTAQRVNKIITEEIE